MKWEELEAKYGTKETEVTNLKEFFKPKKNKIVLTVVLAILSLVLYVSISEHYITIPLDSSEIEVLYTVIYGFGFLLSRYLIELGLQTLVVSSLFWIVSLIYWYLLSCLLIFIYNKLRIR